MINMVFKNLNFYGLPIYSIKKSNEIFIEFTEFCNLFSLSSGYYAGKIRNSSLSKALNKQVIPSANGLRYKNIFNIKYLDELFKLWENIWQNKNMQKINSRLDEFLIFTYSAFDDLLKEEYLPFSELIIEPKGKLIIKEINFKAINLLVLKKFPEDKIFISLKNVFEEFGLDPIIELQKLQLNEFFINNISKIPLEIGKDIRNMFFIDLEGFFILLEQIPVQRDEIIPYFEDFKLQIKSLIKDAFEEKTSIHIPKTFLEALNKIITTEEENCRLKEEVLKLKLENSENRKKAEMYDLMLDARNSQDMKQVANVFGIGRNRLFEFLREKNILIDEGPEHNLPYQKYIDSGYFIVRRVIIHRTNGDELKTQTLVTPKGIGFIGRVLKKTLETGYLNILMLNNSKHLTDILQN